MDEGASIGQTLSRRREERGLSIEQAAFQSRVPLRLAHVLESDDYHLVPDAFYMIRVLYDYARFLGLDTGEMERAFRGAIQRHAKAVSIPGPAAPVVTNVSWRHVAWTGAGILVVVPLVFIALSLSSQRESPPPARPRPSAEVPLREEPSVMGSETKAVASGEPTPVAPMAAADQVAALTGARPVEVPPAEMPKADPAPAAAPTPAKEAATDRKLRRFLLVAEALEQTWMAVRSDGGEPRQVLLRSGERVRFGADRGFVLTVGNAGGVRLSLNGEPLPLLGKSGEVVRDLTLPRDGGTTRVAPAAEGP